MLAALDLPTLDCAVTGNGLRHYGRHSHARCERSTGAVLGLGAPAGGRLDLQASQW